MANGNYLPFMVGLQAMSGAYSSFERGRAEKSLAKTNRFLSDLRAKDARRRGEELESLSRQKTKKLRGSQRAALAAQGIRIDTGSALDVQLETEDIGELDALAIKSSAMREAFGHKVEGRQIGLQGRLDYRAGVTRSLDTILTGGLKTHRARRQG